ncbi:MAG: prepilin-type N-terminal cleavage/methylation domain-containing protein [Candidatus Omnitrophica bacterium]|nr:prepilin-type N-terminal cleavage/methylation domain-containing protein [Candidatus Omnitrophota bacterium]
MMFKINYEKKVCSKSRALKGFTLVEMIMVITIFSIIGVSIAVSFLSGMKIWDRARNVDLRQSDLLLSLEIIAKELRQSVSTSFVSFEGTAQEVSFATLSGASILKVSYNFDSARKVLLRQQMSLADIIKEQNEGENSPRSVISAEDFSLSYFYFDQELKECLWTDTWEEDENIFTAVKLTVQTKTGEFIKTVFIPISG